MEEEVAHWKELEPEQEYQIGHALLKMGHNIRYVPVNEDPGEFVEALRKEKTDVVFNCTESFHSLDRLDFVVPALLESEGICYTGAPPVALMLTRNKAMSKKILAHHGIHVPHFAVFRMGEKVDSHLDMSFPAIVKPLKLDASDGISMSSVVKNREELAERVQFIHKKFSGPAIAEHFIEGRELYVGLLGNNKKLEVLPATEMVFDKNTKPEKRIATKKAKWDEKYRTERGIKNVLARPLAKNVQEEIETVGKIAFRALWLRDFARLDVRLDKHNQIWVIEVNANPYLSKDHEMSIAAHKRGFKWEKFIEEIALVAKKRFKKTKQSKA